MMSQQSDTDRAGSVKELLKPLAALMAFAALVVAGLAAFDRAAESVAYIAAQDKDQRIARATR